MPCGRRVLKWIGRLAIALWPDYLPVARLLPAPRLGLAASDSSAPGPAHDGPGLGCATIAWRGYSRIGVSKL